MVDIKTELKENSVLLSVFSSEFYNKSVINLLQNLKGEKICYVTLNKSSASLTRNFKFNGINAENIFFIDAITSSINKDKKLDNGILISSPAALTELSIAISELLKTEKFSLLVFDSLSTLKTYSNENSAVRFTSSVMNKIRSKEDKGIFTCLEGDVKTNLIEQSSMYVDKVLNYDDLYKKLRKERVTKIGSSLVFIVASLSVLTSLNTGNSNITGFVTSTISAEPMMMPFVFFSVVIALSLTAGIIVRSHNSKNVNKPMEISSKSRLRTKFKNKIHSWLDHFK